MDTEIRQSIDQGLLQRAHVGAHIALPFAQVHNRITYNLARTVIGNIPAAVGGIEGDTGAA